MTDKGDYKLYQKIGLGAGIVAFVLILIIGGLSPPTTAAAMTALMVVWWMTEALPIHYTALVPLFLVPVFGMIVPANVNAAKAPAWLRWFQEGLAVDPGDAVYQIQYSINPYLDGFLFLFLGGMCIGAAMEKWNLHRRIALHIMRLIGGTPERLILGFIIATASLSMWISNTATAVMMVPIGLAVIHQLEEGRARLENFGLAVMLAIAYAANVGGIGSLIGTAPNVVFSNEAQSIGHPIGFLDYIPVGLPFVVLFLPLIWYVLTRVARKDRIESNQGREVIDEQIRKLGAMSRGEKYVMFVFILTATLWVFGRPLSGWLLGLKGSKVMDASTAMFAALLLVAVPIGKKQFALDWKSMKRIPWSVLLLLGGSFAMADAVGKSGLGDLLGQTMSSLSEWPPVLAFLGIGFVSVFISAFASNTATTVLMMRLIASIWSGQQPLPYMATASVASSCDFMLPAGTPPNAIVFGSGYVSVPRMMKTGFRLDLAAAILAGLWGWLGLRYILG